MPTAPNRVLSHWHHLVENFQTSALDFYNSVEEAVKDREAPDISFERVEWNELGALSAKRAYLRVKRGRVTFDICCAPYGKGTFFSWWMAETPSFAALGYLLVLVVGLVIVSLLLLAFSGRSLDLACGSFVMIILLWLAGLPIGLILLGSAVASGALGDEEAVLATPVFGTLYALFWNPNSYYRLDTAIMFQETVSRSVSESLNALLSGQGLKALTQEEQSPTMQRFLRDRA